MAPEYSQYYWDKEWLDSRLEIGSSSVDGRGLFATANIVKGEVVVVWGGTVFTHADVAAGKAAPESTVWIGENLFLGKRAGHYDRGRDDRADFMNHSCDPNVWLRDEVTLVSRRAIAAGEELTIDYALFEGNEDYRMPWECRCGTPVCRKQISGKDWRLKQLQHVYREHFSPFILHRIHGMGSTVRTVPEAQLDPELVRIPANMVEQAMQRETEPPRV